MTNQTNSTTASKNDFVFEKEIGEGAYSRVYRTIYKPTGKKYATKIISKARVIREKKVDEVKNEKKVLQLLNHPNVIKLYRTFQDEENLYFALELAPGGEFYDYLKYGKLNLNTTIFYISEIVNALEYIHKMGIIHRDLKPENILLSTNMHILISDFGTSTEKNKVSESSEFVGTAQYLSPEVIEGKSCSEGSDLWALGCIIYQFLTNKHAFDAKSDYLILKKIQEGTIEFPDGFPMVAKDLILKLTKKDPNERIGNKKGVGYKELKSHPFFTGIDFDILNQQIPPPLIPISEIKTTVLISEFNSRDYLDKEEKELLSMIVYHKSHLLNHLKHLIITQNRLMLINNDTSDLKEEMRFNQNLEIQKRNDKEIMIKNILDDQIWVLENESGDGEKLFLRINEIINPSPIEEK
eukprot:gene11894-5300_t